MRLRTAFVPHDLRAPIAGSGSGPLAGLTAAIKDMYDIAGERTGGGNPQWLAAQEPARRTCPAVQRLLDAGATVVGKTICDEFFFSVTGDNAHYGTPLNPRAPDRLPGGSSSGSASAAASNACDFALGSDTGGSVRMPASFCGLFGIRPTHGRIDISGAMPMSPSFDVVGWMTNSPGIFRSVGSVLLGEQGVIAKIESAVLVEDSFAEADPAIVELIRTALSAMTNDLPTPKSVRIAPQGLDPWRQAFRTLQGREVWMKYGAFLTRQRPNLGPGIGERMEFSATVTEWDAAKADAMRAEARAHIRAIVAPGTILVQPTSPSVAPLRNTPASLLETFRVRVQRLSCVAGLSGLPEVTIPVGTVGGAPAGLSFIGWPGGDERLLDLAVKVSRHCGIADS